MTPRRRATLSVAAAVGALAAATAPGTAAAATESIVLMAPGVSPVAARHVIAASGGTITRRVPMINAYGVRASAAATAGLARAGGVRSVTPNVAWRPAGATTRPAPASGTAGIAAKSAPAPSPTATSPLVTSFNESLSTPAAWTSAYRATGKGVGVAVIDTGVAGGVPDFRTSRTDPTSRVVASVVTNPHATTATDAYGHGTHVAGLIAGNGSARPFGDPLAGRYSGTAPEAQIVSVKASDDHGNATLLDVIYGLQFVVDNRAAYNIRVVNLSLESSAPQPYRVDPLDAAVEAAWRRGIVVVAAAGNRGTATDAVMYAPGNDPYVLSVGAVDDRGTKSPSDDTLATWSSRGVTQDGVRKPEVLAPGARMVSVLAPGSDFATLCPSCVVSGQYIRIGGTSMSAAVASGVVADILQAHPTWTPDQVKAAIVGTTRTVAGTGPEISATAAIKADPDKLPRVNVGLTASTLLDASGSIDWTRASWSRASWSRAADPLRASWSRASWSCACSLDASGAVDPARASWSRASWSAAWDK
ncbi:MAG: S8 family peptidase [Thermoleophilia bacterium]|nr:S8 family peptidase [Thermoleophilia bacterium]